jgi:hypothetical protein
MNKFYLSLPPTAKFRGFKFLLPALIFLTGLAPMTSFGNVSLTAPSLTVYACGESFPTGYSILGNIVITEGSNGDFASPQSNATLILTAPANFEFLAGIGNVAFANGNNITSAVIIITATTITVTFSVSGTNKGDVLTISNIRIRGMNPGGPSNILRTAGNPGNGTIAGILNGATNFATLTSTNQVVPSVTSAGSGTICSNTAQSYTITSSVGSTTYNIKNNSRKSPRKKPRIKNYLMGAFGYCLLTDTGQLL